MTVCSGSVKPLANFKMYDKQGNVTSCLKTAGNLKTTLAGYKTISC